MKKHRIIDDAVPPVDGEIRRYRGTYKKWKTCEYCGEYRWASIRSRGQGGYAALCDECCRATKFRQNKPSLGKISEIAMQHNAVLLPTAYWKRSSKLHFWCNIHQEIFEMSYECLQNGRGCRYCGRETISAKQRLSDAEVRCTLSDMGFEPNGILRYKNVTTTMRLLCIKCRNQVNICLGAIKNGQRCSFCFPNQIGETICRYYLQYFFDVDFPKQYPKFLHGLELDCYNEKLQLACEYDGQQHFAFVEKFHETKEDFENQRKRDRTKDDLCAKNGVNLIRISYRVKYTDIGCYIKQKLNDFGFEILKTVPKLSDIPIQNRDQKLDDFLASVDCVRVGQFVDLTTPVNISCNICGSRFERIPKNVMTRKYACGNCRSIERGRISKNDVGKGKLRLESYVRSTQRFYLVDAMDVFYGYNRRQRADYGTIQRCIESISNKCGLNLDVKKDYSSYPYRVYYESSMLMKQQT